MSSTGPREGLGCGGGCRVPPGPRDSHQAGGYGSHFLPRLPRRGQDIRGALLHGQSPPLLPRGFPSAPGEAQRTNAESSPALPASLLPRLRWRGTGASGRRGALSPPPTEVFLGVQVSSKIRRKRLFSAPPNSSQPTRGAVQPPAAVPRAPTLAVQSQTPL